MLALRARSGYHFDCKSSTRFAMSIKSDLKSFLLRRPKLFWGARSIYHRLGFGSRTEEDCFYDIARQGSEIFAMQIGANDGIMHDQLHLFILAYGWHGLLVEPVKYLYDRLITNYAGAPGLMFENAAIADRDGTRTLYRVRPAAHHPAWCEGIGSFNRDHLLAQKAQVPDIEEYIVQEEVACILFASLVQKHRILRVDVLVIDVEGYDFEILRQFDFERMKPSLVMYEHINLSPDDKQAAVALLRSHGYEVRSFAMNNVALAPVSHASKGEGRRTLS